MLITNFILFNNRKFEIKMIWIDNKLWFEYWYLFFLLFTIISSIKPSANDCKSFNLNDSCFIYVLFESISNNHGVYNDNKPDPFLYLLEFDLNIFFVRIPIVSLPSLTLFCYSNHPPLSQLTNNATTKTKIKTRQKNKKRAYQIRERVHQRKTGKPSNNNKNKKKQNEEMKIDESLEIRGINLIPMEKYKECWQTYPPSKPVKDLWEEKQYEIIQTMPHPYNGKMYVCFIKWMR